jgi:hypothetical protein
MIPIENGNAINIKQVCLGIMPLVLLRFEELVDFLTEEPEAIGIMLSETDSERMFEQVLRIRQWIPNISTISWSVYSESREWDLKEDNSGIVIRRVKWDRSFDIKKTKGATKDERISMLNDWPTVEMKNIYLSKENLQKEIKTFQKFDQILRSGITLIKRDISKKPIWGDMEVLRKFNWGKYHAVWDFTMMSKPIEDFSKKICKMIEDNLNSNFGNIYQIRLDYSIPPELEKSIIYGSTS